MKRYVFETIITEMIVCDIIDVCSRRPAVEGQGKFILYYKTIYANTEAYLNKDTFIVFPYAFCPF